METRLRGNDGNIGKIALLVGIIIVAAAMLAFSYYRSTSSESGTISPEVKQMKPGVRSRGRQMMSPGMSR